MNCFFYVTNKKYSERLGLIVNRLYDKLSDYSKMDYYPMHMPGHKRNTGLLSFGNPYSIDITEIEGFDNLHQAEGILLELGKRLQKLYGADQSYPLVNGSTVGILAGISALAERGSRIIIARNCHKAVYHAVLLRELEPVYLYPELIPQSSINGGIQAREIEELLITYPDVKLVAITSPTYEGVVSDIRAIADAAHRAGALLLVDEAHGAHFGFHEAFPQSAVTQGADIVIQSLHKTLPAFTQTAVLHSNTPEYNRLLEHYLAIYESSSPSYLLMAGIDRCISLIEDHGKELFDVYYDRLCRFYGSMGALKQLHLMDRSIVGCSGVYDLDPSKLTIRIRSEGLTGPELFRKLSTEYHIIPEMETRDYVVGMTGICDTEEGFDRLQGALLKLDEELSGWGTNRRNCSEEISKPDRAMLPYEALEALTEEIRLSEGKGRVSAAFISIYPPGIPILVPGEIIDDNVLKYLERVRQDGLTITGLLGTDRDRIRVVGRG